MTIRACVCLLLLGVASCAGDPTQGYSMRQIFAEDVSTIEVGFFRNDTFTRDVQFDLAEALVKTIESQTPWKVVQGSMADTQLTGTIRQVGLRRISKSPTTGLAEEDALSVTVDFEWRSLRDGKTIVRRQAFTSSALFVPTLTSNEPIEIGRYAVVQQLAEDIVATLRGVW